MYKYNVKVHTYEHMEIYLLDLLVFCPFLHASNLSTTSNSIVYFFKYMYMFVLIKKTTTENNIKKNKKQKINKMKKYKQ